MFINKFSKYLFSSVLCLFICLSACSDDKKNENRAANPNVHTFIFIDKTASVDVTKPFVIHKYQQALQSIIEQNINQAGDKLEVYYVHENTSKGRSLSLVARTVLENTEGMNETDIEAIRTAYDLSIKKERNIFIKQALSRLVAENNGASNKETNLTASIPVVSQAKDGNTLVKVYYFSDMVESVKNGRDFHVKAPISATEVEEWAKADTKKLKNYSLENVDISMILPFEPTSSSKENNPNITAYWQKLFRELGVANVVEE